MKAYVITLAGSDYSQRQAAQCIATAAEHGLKVEQFDAVPAADAAALMNEYGLRWTWARNNTAADICPDTGLKQHPYGRLDAKIGCSMSHYLLWSWCVQVNEPILILEHDAVFLRPLPKMQFDGICQVNDPAGATPRGAEWSERMQARGPGVFAKSVIFTDGRPDGLAGNSAYLIKPWAAREAIRTVHEIGLWPNDATLCRQLFPYLQELYPFITRVDQRQSTTCDIQQQGQPAAHDLRSASGDLRHPGATPG